MSYTPLRSWTIGDVTVSESEHPDSVLIHIGTNCERLTEEQFEALCSLYSKYSSYDRGDKIRFIKPIASESIEDEAP